MYNLHIMRCTYLNCTIWLILTSGYIHETITTSNKLNTSSPPKVSQYPFVIPPSCPNPYPRQLLTSFLSSRLLLTESHNNCSGFCLTSFTQHNYSQWDSSMLLCVSIVHPCPGWSGPVGGALPHKPKGRAYNCWSRNMPGLRVQSPFRVCARSNQSMFFSLSFSLPPPLSGINQRKKNSFFLFIIG